MSRRCCIAVCPNAKTGADRATSFYPFPANAKQREQWLEFIGANPARFQWRSKYVCSAHFLSTALHEANGKASLVEGAIPTIFADSKDEESDVEDAMDEERGDLSDTDMVIDTEAVKIEDIELRTLFCRICIKKSTNLVPLESTLHDTPLVDVIRTISRLKIEPSEILPTMVCSACIEKIDVAYSVHLEFNNNGKFLLKLLEGKQLENYYKLYDERKDLGDISEDYLSVMIQNFKQEHQQEEEFVITALESAPNSDDDESKPTTQDVAETEEYNEVFLEEYLEDAVADNVDEEITSELTLNDVNVIGKRVQIKSIPSKASTVSTASTAKRPKRLKRTKRVPPNPAQPRPIRQINSRAMIPRKINEYRPPPKLVPNTCYICNTSYESAETLEDHMGAHVEELPFTCKECHCPVYPAVFKTLVSLNRHLLGHLYPYKCDYCWVRSPSRFGYKAHMRNKHDTVEDGYTCDTCGEFFSSNGAFRRHVGKHRALEEERYKCQHCGKLFGLLQLLQRHERIHTGEKPFECKTCGKAFNHEHNFRIHTRRHINENPYTCDVCGKVFNYHAGLRTHLSRHFPDDPQYREKKPYVSSSVKKSLDKSMGVQAEEFHCDVEGCNFVCYRDKYREIYNHRARHNRPYSCSICQKTYITNQSLKFHISSVHDDKPPEKIFQCTYCPKWFRDNSKLRQHLNIHEDVRAFKCQFCDKSFVQKINCTAHERIHTGEQPHPCRHCPARFASPSQRNKHEAKCHPELVAAVQVASAT